MNGTFPCRDEMMMTCQVTRDFAMVRNVEEMHFQGRLERYKTIKNSHN